MILVSLNRYCAYTPVVDDAAEDETVGPSHSVLFWVVLLSGSYLIINAAALIAEYLSEMSKLDRGFYTDTFSPFLYSNLFTIPVSKIHNVWPGYPDVFQVDEWRQQVRDAVLQVSINIVIQTVLLIAVITLTLRKSRRP
jgi:hypothetical protein